MNRVGTCSLCGGLVMGLRGPWYGVNPPPPDTTRRRCGGRRERGEEETMRTPIYEKSRSSISAVR